MTPGLRSAAIGSLRSSAAGYRDLLLVLAIALGLRLLFGALTADTYDYDEFVLLLLARDFAHGAVPYRDFMFFHPPGILVLLRAIEPLTSRWWLSARILMELIDTVTVGLVWLLARRLYDSGAALAAALLYAFSPLALISGVRVGQDPVITLLLVLGLAFLVLRTGPGPAIAAGACLGLAIWVKYPAAVWAPVFLLASPRRAAVTLCAAAASLAVLFAFTWPEARALYQQTVAFQRVRWTMDLGQRLQTVAIFWVLCNPLVWIALLRPRAPIWLVTGFALGAVFLVGSQIYYHYFVPVVPFAALLSAPLAATLARRRPVFALLGAGAVVLGWGLVIARGGPSPLYVTAAHLSDIAPTVRLIDARSAPSSAILADRYEYAYLARRAAVAHYFWNVGVLVSASYLETHMDDASLVVLSYGASSGFPSGFVRYLDRRYRRVLTPANTVWIAGSKR